MTIYLGLPDEEKRAAIERHRAQHDIRHVVVISADDSPLEGVDADHVKYSDTIMYVTFYRLLQEIGPGSLVVVNECLRTQNRYDLTYNCMRQFLNQAGHQLIFQQLPQIDTREDFMVLFDFDTKSRWKRNAFDADLIAAESQVVVQRVPVTFEKICVQTSGKTKTKYATERDKLFRDLGGRDPHIIPRNLYLIGGTDKLAYINSQDMPLFGTSDQMYVARNKRLKSERIVTYDEVQPGQTYTVLELPHRFIDYSDFIKRTGQARAGVLCADLKVDQWYFQRYVEWSERIHETYASLSK